MPVWKCKRTVSSSEFVDWLAFFDVEPNMFHREDYYWAQIAAWVKRLCVSSRTPVRVNDMLIKFAPEKQKETSVQKGEAAKSFFFKLGAMKKIVDKRSK